jgi:DNA replication protein DnaC
VLEGASGCGKTHLAAAIANKVLASGASVFFTVVPDLLDELRATFAPGKEAGTEEWFAQVREADLLVLDDLGAHASSLWASEKLYQIVNFRTVAGLPMVVTTNLTNDALLSAHPRIASRLLDPAAGTSLYIYAPHHRLGRAGITAQPGPRSRA